jgi:hypothetical protein
MNSPGSPKSSITTARPHKIKKSGRREYSDVILPLVEVEAGRDRL